MNKATFLAFLGPLALLAQTATPTFQYNIVSAKNTPGQGVEVIFSVKNPVTGALYDIKTDPAFTATANGASRLFVQVGWDTRDYTNTGSGSELAPVGAAAALPIGVNALAASVPLGNGTYKVTSKPLPATATGSGVALLEGHPAGPDATGAYTVRVPVKSVFKNFAIVPGSASVARRQVVDVAKCKSCHGTLTLHGNNRTDEIQVCVVCHNPNATDIAYRQPGDGPEQPLDFKRMVHSIHAGKMRQAPLVIIGFNHSINDFTNVKFPAELSNCQKCHLPNTYTLPLNRNVLATTIDTRSNITLPKNIVNNDPNDDLNITPTAAVCSACHGGSEVRRHMERNGASFAALQQSINSGAIKERCANCHGIGKEKDVLKVHQEEEEEHH